MYSLGPRHHRFPSPNTDVTQIFLSISDDPNYQTIHLVILPHYGCHRTILTIMWWRAALPKNTSTTCILSTMWAVRISRTAKVTTFPAGFQDRCVPTVATESIVAVISVCEDHNLNRWDSRCCKDECEGAEDSGELHVSFGNRCLV